MREKLRKTLAALLSLAMLAGLAACGGDEPAPEEELDESGAPELDVDPADLDGAETAEPGASDEDEEI